MKIWLDSHLLPERQRTIFRLWNGLELKGAIRKEQMSFARRMRAAALMLDNTD